MLSYEEWGPQYIISRDKYPTLLCIVLHHQQSTMCDRCARHMCCPNSTKIYHIGEDSLVWVRWGSRLIIKSFIPNCHKVVFVNFFDVRCNLFSPGGHRSRITCARGCPRSQVSCIRCRFAGSLEKGNLGLVSKKEQQNRKASTHPVLPLHLGSLASSHAMMVGSFAYRLTKVRR